MNVHAVSPAARFTQLLIRTVSPLVLALVAGGLIIWALGVPPLRFYGDVFTLGVMGTGWQRSLTAAAPLLMIALGLIIAFRARLWNLGYNGSYLLAAAVVAGTAPELLHTLPFGLGVLLLILLAAAVGALSSVLPALLKSRYHTNEIVTSLMMSFIAIGLANLLVKGPLTDPSIAVSQTRTLEVALMLPYIPGTRIHVGVLLALALVLACHLLLLHTPFGLTIDMIGASHKAALHAGIPVRRLIVLVFLLSSSMVAVAAAIDMLGLWGYTRAGWNPAYGDKVLPFVFLARLHPIGVVPLIMFYAILATGGTIAAGRAGLSVDFLLVIIALILFFMSVIEYLGRGRSLGSSYLPGVSRGVKY